MNITIFIGGLTGGGAERVVCNLANFLSNNHKVTLLTMSETIDAYGVSDKVTIKALLRENERKNFLFDNIRRYRALRKYIKCTANDVYVVMLPITTMFLLHFRNIIKVPIISAERCDPNSYSKIKQYGLKHMARRSDAWVFQTEDAKKWYGPYIKNSIVIPNAINSEFIKKDIYNGPREADIVAVGRLNSQKNFEMLIQAFSEISHRMLGFKLKIYGKGPLENELKKKTQELSMTENVIFCGYVDDMAKKLEKATMFIMSSNFEGMPNALMEAMALGLPCISTDCPCGGPSFLIKSGINGILVPVGNKEALKKALIELADDPEKRKIMGTEAHKVIYELSPEKIYRKWEDFLIEVLLRNE